MSTVVVDELIGRQENNYVIGVPPGTFFKVPGSIIQTVWNLSDVHATYTSNADNVSREISILNTTISPKYSNSEIWIDIMLFYEASNDITFQMLRNGGIITSPQPGYNSQIGNVRHSGVTSTRYETSFDQNSTPDYLHITFVDFPATTGATTYGIGSRYASGTNSSIRINRAWGQIYGDYEKGVSQMILREIAR
jgi:hypothetical protein